MNIKEYKKLYPFSCSDCGSFNHTLREYCENCGAQNTMRQATKEEYKKLSF